MQPADFTEEKAGKLVKSARGYWAFVPYPLPPRLEPSWELASEISAADRGLSELGADSPRKAVWTSIFCNSNVPTNERKQASKLKPNVFWPPLRL